MHLHKYLLSGQVGEGKMEMHTSVQAQVQEVAGSKPFPILTCIYGRLVKHFLIKTTVQGVIQGIAWAGTHHYVVVQLKDK